MKPKSYLSPFPQKFEGKNNQNYVYHLLPIAHAPKSERCVGRLVCVPLPLIRSIITKLPPTHLDNLPGLWVSSQVVHHALVTNGTQPAITAFSPAAKLPQNPEKLLQIGFTSWQAAVELAFVAGSNLLTLT